MALPTPPGVVAPGWGSSLSLKGFPCYPGLDKTSAHKGRRWVLTFSRDIILVFPENMLCKAGDEGHRCSVWDLRAQLVTLPSVGAHPLPPPVLTPPTL